MTIVVTFPQGLKEQNCIFEKRLLTLLIMQCVADVLLYLCLTEPKKKVIQIQHSIDSRNTKIFHSH